MRHTLAGLVLFLVLLPAAAFAQIRGDIESIGFGSYYRPDCWTPMVVRLRTAGLKTDRYNLQVIQEDLDRDRPLITRQISIDTSQPEQRFWMYFIPQPTGLADAQGGGSLDQLRKDFRVQLTTVKGVPVGQLNQTQLPTSLDGPSGQAVGRDRKLILVIYDGTSSPSFREYNSANSVGMSEQPIFVLMRPGDLPESALAYDGIDAILWLNADARLLDDAGARRGAAIDQYVRQGGRLVVCQPTERDRLIRLAPLLPIEYLAPGGGTLFQVQIKQAPGLEPLQTIARNNGAADTTDDHWSTVPGPYLMAAATPRPNALVEGRTIEWADGTHSPWIVRGVYGLGGVTWVAQDLGNPTLTARTAMDGWARVWDTVFAWNNDTQDRNQSGELEKFYPDASQTVDVGYTMLQGMNQPGHGTFLVLLAVVFFILYWIAAGPGSYLALINWKKKQWSWLAFGAVAVVATLVTMAIVKLVLRGPPVIKHVTVVQAAPGDPAVIRSRIGLYIPRDDPNTPVELADTAPQSLSYVAAFAQNPQHRSSNAERPPRQQSYELPVPDDTAVAPAVVNFPFRSTLKKLESKWVGPLPGRVDGKARLARDPLRGVDGRLSNNTGIDLAHIYIAFRNTDGLVRIFYRETWGKGTVIDFQRDVADRPLRITPPGISFTQEQQRQFATPGDRRQNHEPIVDSIGTGRGDYGWTAWWFPGLRSAASPNNGAFDDSQNQFSRSFPVMALFDLIPTVEKRTEDDNQRFEIFRRGVRHINLSQVVSNGQMLVLAVAADKQPLPYPFLIYGDRYGGEGDVLYEFVVPLDRTLPEEPVEPATGPATTTAPVATPAAQR
jgi:hypothetical protein